LCRELQGQNGLLLVVRRVAAAADLLLLYACLAVDGIKAMVLIAFERLWQPGRVVHNVWSHHLAFSRTACLLFVS